MLDALRVMRDRRATSIQPREDVWKRFNEDVDERMEGTVWNTGCGSYCIDGAGRNSALWPDWTWGFRRRAQRLDPSEYELRTGRVEEPVAA